jgi:hypothetical protein
MKFLPIALRANYLFFRGLIRSKFPNLLKTIPKEYYVQGMGDPDKPCFIGYDGLPIGNNGYKITSRRPYRAELKYYSLTGTEKIRYHQ